MNCRDCEEMMERFFDDDGNLEERKRVLEHCRTCPACDQLVRSYEKLEHGLHSLGAVHCPSSVVEAIVRETVAAETTFVQRVFRDLATFLRTRPGYALAGACAALLLLMTVFPLFQPRQQVPGTLYTRAELEEADQQVKAALASVNHYTRKANTIIKHDVLINGVAVPLKSSLNQAFKPIFNGEQS